VQPLITDARFESLVTLGIAVITAGPIILGAYWAKTANYNSKQARQNSADALHEVKANGGMSDPDPTLKDYIKFVGESVEQNTRRTDKIEALLEEHLKHSRIMDSALAEVFMAVKPDLKNRDPLEDPFSKD
jgi:hypothetical protein